MLDFWRLIEMIGVRKRFVKKIKPSRGGKEVEGKREGSNWERVGPPAQNRDALVVRGSVNPIMGG